MLVLAAANIADASRRSIALPALFIGLLISAPFFLPTCIDAEARRE
jgi:hypothetical protein